MPTVIETKFFEPMAARVGGIPVDQWGDEAIGPVGKWLRTDWPLKVSQALS